MAAGQVLKTWGQSQALDSVYANEQRLCLCVSSHHYLEHRAEDLGVLCHTADVERPGEDGRVVVLIQHLDEDLGCVSWEKIKNKRCSMCLANWG